LSLAAANNGVPPAATIAASCFNSSSDQLFLSDFMKVSIYRNLVLDRPVADIRKR
jgi:hypothetical protein